MSNLLTFDFWKKTHNGPYHFPMDAQTWHASMYEDVDSDGHKLFDQLTVRCSASPEGVMNGMIVYGSTAFGFDSNGELSVNMHHKVIRDFWFHPNEIEAGRNLLHAAMDDLGREQRIHAFFHYFGMSACGRHGKLHASQTHIHNLLLENGFVVEHENVYYSKMLTEDAPSDPRIQLVWKERNAGDCREFAAISDGCEIGWGQIHFLPQEHIAYLRWIYIDEKRQHQGLGTDTMGALCAQLKTMGITRLDTDTALSNCTAQKYYEKTGYIHCGITRSYFTK